MPSNQPSKADRREQAKAAADALRAKQARAAARQRTIAIVSLVVGLVVVVTLVMVILNNGKSSSTAATGDQLTPAAASAHGGFVFDQTGRLDPPSDQGDGTSAWPEGLAASGGPVVVSVYYDFMCPWCGEFERTQGPTLDALLASGAIVLDSHPLAILDRYSAGSNFSTRSAAAAIAVAEGDPSHYFSFVEAMMATDTQPKENTAGLTNAEIADVAKGVGVTQDVLDQITSGAYTDFAGKATEIASQDLGSLSTPTILINGKNLTQDLGVDWTKDGALAAAVAAAAQG
jgi:protein-disulfide isomerase